MAALDANAPPDPAEFLERAGTERAELEALLATLAELTPPTPVAFGRFLIRETIRAGGQGKVYLAHDPDLGRDVALKVLDDTRLDPHERAWVLNEARSIARLRHPGIVEIFDVGEEDGRAFLVMELLSARSLANAIDELSREPDADAPAPPSLAERLDWLIHLANALAFCHGSGVLHRDVNPSNILFGADGLPRFIDFGLAHTGDDETASALLITQRLIGTPGYIAPEQLDLQQTGSDPRSDQFAFGVVCYELLTRTRPFPGKTLREINAAVLGTAPPKRLRSHEPSVSARLERVVMHALEKEPGERYGSVSELARDLEAVRDQRPISVESPHAGTPPLAVDAAPQDRRAGRARRSDARDGAAPRLWRAPPTRADARDLRRHLGRRRRGRQSCRTEPCRARPRAPRAAGHGARAQRLRVEHAQRCQGARPRARRLGGALRSGIRSGARALRARWRPVPGRWMERHLRTPARRVSRRVRADGLPSAAGRDGAQRQHAPALRTDPRCHAGGLRPASVEHGLRKVRPDRPARAPHGRGVSAARARPEWAPHRRGRLPRWRGGPQSHPSGLAAPDARALGTYRRRPVHSSSIAGLALRPHAP